MSEERQKEIATLRALALTQRQVGALLLLESFLMSLLAWCLALGLGSALAWVLLRVINVRSFGWSLPWSWPWETWMQKSPPSIPVMRWVSWHVLLGPCNGRSKDISRN